MRFITLYSFAWPTTTSLYRWQVDHDLRNVVGVVASLMLGTPSQTPHFTVIPPACQVPLVVLIVVSIPWTICLVIHIFSIKYVRCMHDALKLGHQHFTVLSVDLILLCPQPAHIARATWNRHRRSTAVSQHSCGALSSASESSVMKINGKHENGNSKCEITCIKMDVSLDSNFSFPTRLHTWRSIFNDPKASSSPATGVDRISLSGVWRLGQGALFNCHSSMRALHTSNGFQHPMNTGCCITPTKAHQYMPVQWQNDQWNSTPSAVHAGRNLVFLTWRSCLHLKVTFHEY